MVRTMQVRCCNRAEHEQCASSGGGHLHVGKVEDGLDAGLGGRGGQLPREVRDLQQRRVPLPARLQSEWMAAAFSIVKQCEASCREPEQDLRPKDLPGVVWHTKGVSSKGVNCTCVTICAISMAANAGLSQPLLLMTSTIA